MSEQEQLLWILRMAKYARLSEGIMIGRWRLIAVVVAVRNGAGESSDIRQIPKKELPFGVAGDNWHAVSRADYRPLCTQSAHMMPDGDDLPNKMDTSTSYRPEQVFEQSSNPSNTTWGSFVYISDCLVHRSHSWRPTQLENCVFMHGCCQHPEITR